MTASVGFVTRLGNQFFWSQNPAIQEREPLPVGRLKELDGGWVGVEQNFGLPTYLVIVIDILQRRLHTSGISDEETLMVTSYQISYCRGPVPVTVE